GRGPPIGCRWSWSGPVSIAMPRHSPFHAVIGRLGTNGKTGLAAAGAPHGSRLSGLMDRARTVPHLNRRSLLIGGGAGLGLLVAWSVWPRSYEVNLRAGPGE